MSPRSGAALVVRVTRVGQGDRLGPCLLLIAGRIMRGGVSPAMRKGGIEAASPLIIVGEHQIGRASSIGRAATPVTGCRSLAGVLKATAVSAA